MCKISLTQNSHKATVQQTYRFEFGSDSRIHSVSFKGSIQEPQIRGILESAQRTSYEKCGEAIRTYLDSHNLDYIRFTVQEKLIRGRLPIQFADKLLHASSCSVIDQCIGKAAVYYGVMDYQYWMGACCQGCYYAVARIPSAQDGPLAYHVISQTFAHGASCKDEWSHFAIRKSDGGHHLATLDEENSRPVLATFGCVDMTGLLINIADVTTKQKAAMLANK